MTVAMATANYAFDKQSARSFDAEGRMRVRNCVISVAEINPYYGREIPGFAKLGLDPNAVYDMYRDPGELERAADSFNGMSLMIRHVAQTAQEPRKEYGAGSVINPRFEKGTGQLRGDLFVYDARAIEYVESGELADLSSSYRYTPDMTPGEVNGRKYHGVMRNIEANHVALVATGRATGAHVADSALTPQTGANPVDPNNIPNDPANAAANDPTPAASAAPSDLAAVAQALLMLTNVINERLPAAAAAPGVASNGEPATPISVDPPVVIGEDGEGAGEEAPAGAEGDPSPDTEEDDAPPAMDAKAVQAVVQAAVKAERARAEGVVSAKASVRHILGDMIAMDSAADIYRAALKQQGVDVSKIAAGHELTAWTAFSAAAGAQHALAQDSRLTPADTKSSPFDAHLSRITNLGR